MSNTMRPRIPQIGDVILAAPRQVWLATLGAAAVTRDWAEREAGSVFRALVKEGSAVESHAIRRVSDGVGRSMRKARSFASTARSGVETSVASLANGASALLRARLPATRTSVAVERESSPRRRSGKPVKHAAKPRTRKSSGK